MEDLTAMGCRGFAELPWGFREERIVKELLGAISNEFANTLRGVVSRWNDEAWRTVYNFRPGGSGMANRKDEFIRDKFRGTVNPKDGFAIEDCIDDRHRRLLAFLVPVLHPEKPTRVTITLGNTIFGSLSGERKVDWARIVSELVLQLVSRVGKSRATPVCPYLFHLYHENQLLTDREEKVWRTQEVIRKYGESETDDEKADVSGSETESEDEREDTPAPPNKRQKTTPPNQRGTPPAGDRPDPEVRPEVEGAGSAPESDPQDPFTQLIGTLCNIRADWEVKKRTLAEIGKLVDAPVDSKLPGKVAHCITDPGEYQRQETAIRKLQDEVDSLKEELFTFKENEAATRAMAEETRKLAEQVRATVGESGSALAKAKLFDEKVQEDKKISGSRVIRILTDFSEELELTMTMTREAASRMEVCSHKLVGAVDFREIRLSDLSLPDSFPGAPAPEGGKDATPESKRSKVRTASAATPVDRVDLVSPEGGSGAATVNTEGERNRSLNPTFERMEPGVKSPTIGSQV
jgi:hypothetical protein